MKTSYLNQIISAVTHANFFCVPDLPESIRLGMDTFELVLSLVMMGSQEGILKSVLLVDQIKTCCINGNRIERGKDSDVRNNRGITEREAVAVRSDTDEKIHKPDLFLFSFHCTIRVFNHPFHKNRNISLPVYIDRVFRADMHTLKTTNAECLVDHRFVLLNADR